MKASDVVRSPRALVGVALLAALLVGAAAGLARARGGGAPPDPWLCLAAAALGAWLLLDGIAARTRARVSERLLARHPELPVLTCGDAMAGDPTADVAWSSRPVRLAWRRRAVRGAWPFAVAALVVAGVVLPLRTWADADATLARTGVRTAGTVTATHWAFEGRGGRPVATVEYPFAGRTWTADVTGIPTSTPLATQVPLLVDAEHPDQVRAEDAAGTTSGLQWWVTLGSVLATALTGLGLARLTRAFAWRRELRRRPWLVGSTTGGRPVLVETSRARAVAHPGRTGRVGAGAVMLLPRGPRVLASPAAGGLVELRLPGSVAQGRRWLRALGASAGGSGAGEDRHEEVAAVEGAQVPGGEARVDA